MNGVLLSEFLAAQKDFSGCLNGYSQLPLQDSGASTDHTILLNREVSRSDSLDVKPLADLHIPGG